MNPLNPASTPQVAAVTQTLAGERMSCSVNFPTTGDSDCDFIQGVLAVGKALDVSPHLAIRVLRYLLERFGLELEGLKEGQPIMGDHLWARVNALEKWCADLQRHQGLGSMGSLGPMGGPINPYTTPVCPPPPCFASSSANPDPYGFRAAGIPDHIKAQAAPTPEQLATFMRQIDDLKP